MRLGHSEGERIIKTRKGALNRVAERGSHLVEDADILITCSNSDTVVRCLRAARERQMPFYVICETTKFGALRLAGRHLWLEEAFEAIPPPLITRAITEEGSLRVVQGAVKVQQMAGNPQGPWA